VKSQTRKDFEAVMMAILQSLQVLDC